MFFVEFSFLPLAGPTNRQAGDRRSARSPLLRPRRDWAQRSDPEAAGRMPAVPGKARLPPARFMPVPKAKMIEAQQAGRIKAWLTQDAWRGAAMLTALPLCPLRPLTLNGCPLW